MELISIKGLDKAKVLKALWDHSHAEGLSRLKLMALDDKGFTLDKAEELIEDQKPHRLHFYYVYGHVIKCDITEDYLDPWLYDKACGEGAAQKAINDLRKEEALMNAEYKGTVVQVEIKRSSNNDRIAEIFYEAFKGSQDYKDSNIVINKDPDETTGKDKVGVYICADDLINRNEVIDTLGIAIKSVKDLM